MPPFGGSPSEYCYDVWCEKQTLVQFVFAVPWIIRNKTLPPIVECLTLSYTFLYLIVMDCWKYCKGYKFALPVARPRAKKLSASGELYCPWPPDQGLCSWTPLGALLPDPRYRLALYALVPVLWPSGAGVACRRGKGVVNAVVTVSVVVVRHRQCYNEWRCLCYWLLLPVTLAVSGGEDYSDYIEEVVTLWQLTNTRAPGKWHFVSSCDITESCALTV